MQHTLSSALFAAAVIGGVTCFSAPVAACNSEPYIGTICTFAMDWCPYGYMAADGRTLPVREYTALFGVIGFTYGGDNANNFAIPDLRGRGTIGKGQGAGFTQNVALGQKVGQQSIVLTQSQVPLIPHTHTATFTGTGGGGSGPLVANGNVKLPLSGSVSNVTVNATAGASAVTGTISTKALSTASSGGVNLPSATNNTVGRVSGGSATFYQPGTSDVAVPTTFDLNVAGGAITGTATGGTLSGHAEGLVTLPVTGATGITGGSVTVAPAGQGPAQAVPTYSPSMGQTVCIAVLGLFPSRP